MFLQIKFISIILLTIFFGLISSQTAFGYTKFTVTDYDSSTGTFTATSTVSGGVNGGNGDWDFSSDPCANIYLYNDISSSHDQSTVTELLHSTSVTCTSSGTDLTFQSNDFINLGYIYIQPNSATNYSASNDFKLPSSFSTPTPPLSGYTRFTVTGYDATTGTFTATSTVSGGVNGGNGDWDFSSDPCTNIYIYSDNSVNKDQSSVTAVTHSTSVSCTAVGTDLTFQSDDFIDLGYIFLQPNSVDNYSASNNFKFPLSAPTPILDGTTNVLGVGISSITAPILDTFSPALPPLDHSCLLNGSADLMVDIYVNNVNRQTITLESSDCTYAYINADALNFYTSNLFGEGTYYFVVHSLSTGNVWTSNTFVHATPTATPTPIPTMIPTSTPTMTPSPTPTSTPTPTNTPTPVRQLTSLSPARVWMGKAIGDAGLKLDVLAEVYKGSTLVSSGQTNSVTVGSGIFATADLITVPFNSFSPTVFPVGTQLKIKVSARNACNGSLRNQGTARLWFNDAQANSSFDATIATVNHDYYLRNGSVLTTTVGTGPRQNIDVQAGAKCSAFKPFGTWTVTP